jgi:hypothetical protein
MNPNRLALAAVALILAACAPDSSSPADPAAAPAPANEAFAELPAENAEGQWFFRADEGVFAAGFGAPQSEFQFLVACTQGDGAVSITSDHELVPDQPTQLGILTETESLTLPAESFNEGLPHVAANLAGGTANARAVAEALSTAQTRFGVRVGADVRAYPWSEELARALAGCAGA